MLAVAAFALAGAASTALVAWALIWPLWAALWRVSWSPAAANGCERRGAVRRLLVAYATEGCRRACEIGSRRAIAPRSGRRFWSQRQGPFMERIFCHVRGRLRLERPRHAQSAVERCCICFVLSAYSSVLMCQ